MLKWPLFLCILCFLLRSQESWAYAQFIGYGYTSCITCHYNAFGNGPLNDYGRAQGAAVISGSLFNSSKTSDEELAEMSGFLGKTKLPPWWRPAAGYRGMLLTTPVPSAPIQNRYINMQGDFQNTFKFGRHDDLVFSGDFGYAPTPRGTSPTDQQAQKNLISREYYVSARISRPLMIYLGFMDKVYGLRIPDHVAFSRLQTGNAQNDQVHGLVLYYSRPNMDLGINLFAGNLLQDSTLRTQGGSAMIEFEPAEKLRLGFSALYMTNNFVGRLNSAFHIRKGFDEGSSIISEFGVVNTSPFGGASTLGPYNFTQGFLRLFRGFHFVTTLEFYTTDVKKMVTQTLRFGPGIQYFMAQRVELRFDAQNSRFFDPDTVQSDQWNFMSQIHLWF